MLFRHLAIFGGLLLREGKEKGTGGESMERGKGVHRHDVTVILTPLV